MSQKITPFLWFDKNAEEAMEFYTSLFKDGKIVSIRRYPKGPLTGPMKGMEGKVLGGEFQLNGQTFYCIDGGPAFKPNPAVSFYVSCDKQEEVDHYWDALSKGGDVKNQQCGWLTDKFGFSWQIVPKTLPKLLGDADHKKSARVMEAMMKMKKIIVADLQAAAAAEGE